MADDSAEITTKYCSSCKQDVPSANFEMHAIHCQRYLTSCPQCGEPVNKNLLEEHIDENHAQVKCDVCGEKVEKMELDNHKTSVCQKRNVNCKYCEITLPACDMDEHKESCGSRTEECDNCKRRILVKDLEDHVASGCQTPVKTNGKIGQDRSKNRMPERLIGGHDDIRAIPRGFGFPLHAQFHPYPYSDDETRNPYLPGSRTYDVLNNDSPKVSSSVRKTIQKNSTPTNFSTTASTRNISQTNRFHVSNAQRSINVKSKIEDTKPFIPPERRVEQKKASNVPQRTNYENSDSDSDSSDGMEEKKAPPDLTDETLLPCEFCNEMFPADSLGFHQATCDDVPPTPRPPTPPKLKGLSLDPFPSRATSFESYQDEAAALPSNGFPFRRNSPDIGEGSAPCEFCSSSVPLIDLALHQVTCKQNPNLQISSTPEQPASSPPPPPPPEQKERFAKTDIRNPSKSDLPKSHTPQVKPNSSESSRSTVRPPERETKAKTAMASSPNIQAREKRKLAPNFSGIVTNQPPSSKTSNDSSFSSNLTNPSPSSETSPPTQPKIKSRVSDNSTSTTSTSAVERKQQRNKRKSKPIPKITNLPQKFHEVNVLGGDRQNDERPVEYGGPNRSPFETQLPTTTNYYGGDQRSPQTNRSDGVTQVTNPRRMNRGARGKSPTRGHNPQRGHNPPRGHNPTRGYYSTRGRSNGSSTVTIRPRGVNNPRQASGIETLARDVSSQPDLTLQGQTPSFGRVRGSAQRLGSGDSASRSGRTRPYPPKTNNWD